MPVKVERGNRVFPVSDKSSDVIFALQRALKEKKVEVLLHTEVSKLCYEKSLILGQMRKLVIKSLN